MAAAPKSRPSPNATAEMSRVRAKALRVSSGGAAKILTTGEKVRASFGLSSSSCSHELGHLWLAASPALDLMPGAKTRSAPCGPGGRRIAR